MGSKQQTYVSQASSIFTEHGQMLAEPFDLSEQVCGALQASRISRSWTARADTFAKLLAAVLAGPHINDASAHSGAAPSPVRNQSQQLHRHTSRQQRDVSWATI